MTGGAVSGQGRGIGRAPGRGPFRISGSGHGRGAGFDAGRRKNQVAAAESRLREQVESYRKSILTALKEVEDGLNRADFSGRQMSLQQAIEEKAARSFVLVELRYREGADDLLTLLDAQRSLFQAKDQMVLLRLASLDAALDLYRVLGGGWERQSI
ncbi:TolC family protein [Desulfobotulus sp. H1]|uniref:TolC family protein n=1 Tax=Desulfobotulus pelophilus TaxID=2823377 RepID=A0ABT3N9A4_9BACT|nr:TolC family protein [Desulfobotulus pelophilus]MCW7754048.1 TolC family protein [Desulfobotulus pelophilus]